MNMRTRLAVPAAAMLAMIPGLLLAQGRAFQLEEASISDIQGAIQRGERTCKQIVEEYLARARVYNNGLCTALVTADGKPIKPMTGRILAGQPIKYPTQTVAVASVLPNFEQYKGLPIEYGRMQPTVSDPTVQQQYGMRVAFPDSGQLNALETINLRGERSVTCKGKFDAHPSTGPLPKDAPAVCEKFRQYPDALETAAALDKQYGTKPDLAKLPMYCVVMNLKNWYDAKDMRSTGGNDVNFALDAGHADSPDIADLRGNGAGVSVSANLTTCGICEQTSASCKGPASRNGVVNLLATKGVMMDGGPGYSSSGDRAGLHCRTVTDAVKV